MTRRQCRVAGRGDFQGHEGASDLGQAATQLHPGVTEGREGTQGARLFCFTPVKEAVYPVLLPLCPVPSPSSVLFISPFIPVREDPVLQPLVTFLCSKISTSLSTAEAVNRKGCELLGKGPGLGADNYKVPH